MKKVQPFLCLLLVSFFLTARAEMSTTNSPAATPPAASVPTSSSSMIHYTEDPAPDDIDPAKKAEIIKMLELTGRVKMTQDVMVQMIDHFKLQNSRIPPEFWDRFVKEVNVEGLVDKMIPVYAKYYSLDELKALNAFYQTPAGQKMIEATPQIMHDSMQIGQDWGRQLSYRLIAELRAEKAKAAAEAAAATNSATSSAPVTTAAPAPTPVAPPPAPVASPAPAPSAAPSSTPATQQD